LGIPSFEPPTLDKFVIVSRMSPCFAGPSQLAKHGWDVDSNPSLSRLSVVLDGAFLTAARRNAVLALARVGGDLAPHLEQRSRSAAP
jgi:hypothetical protein